LTNYIALFLDQWHWSGPTPPGSGTIYVWGRDEEEMGTISANLRQTYVNNGNAIVDDYTGKAQVLLDKAQIYGMAFYMGLNGVLVPRVTYNTDDVRPDWKPSRDDSTPNPGTGTAKEHDGYRKQGGGGTGSLCDLIFRALGVLNGIRTSSREAALEAAQILGPIYVKCLKGTITTDDIQTFDDIMAEFGI
jgi:hypothetical protein